MKNLTIIGLRLLAIWVFLKALNYLQFLPVCLSNSYNSQGSIGIGMLIVFFLFLASAGILFFKAPFLSTKITSNSESMSLERINYEKLASILFAAIGLLIFFVGLETLFNSVGTVYNQRVTSPQNPNQLLSDIRTILFGGGVQMIIGLVLFIGGKKVANWWYNFRNWT